MGRCGAPGSWPRESLPRLRGRSLAGWGGASSGQGPRREFLLPGQELSRIRDGSRSTAIPAGGADGGNSVITTIRPAPHRGPDAGRRHRRFADRRRDRIGLGRGAVAWLVRKGRLQPLSGELPAGALDRRAAGAGRGGFLLIGSPLVVGQEHLEVSPLPTVERI